MRCLSRLLSFVFCALVLSFPLNGYTQSLYYKGKTITFIQGRSPGGIGDTRIKALLPFLQKHISGNPTIISEYMPGGGGRKAANYMYKAKADGLTIGSASPGILASAVLSEPGVEYDPGKFIYLGSPFSVNNNLFVTRKALGITNVDKLREAAGLRIGGQSVGHVQYIRSRLFAWLLGLKEPKFVVGYSGPELDVALERGEIDSRAVSVDNVTISKEYKQLVDFHAVLEIPKGHRPLQFADLPELETFARSPMERQVLMMSRVFWGVGTLIFLSPGTPEKIADTLREGFHRSFKDPQFHEQYKKMLGADAAPLLPEDQQALVSELPRDAEVAKIFKAIAGMDPLPPRR